MDDASLTQQAQQVMEANWDPLGYTAPNPERYEWQWLWDSCFHAVIWAELGFGDRAVTELAVLLDTMEPSGFLPHMNYLKDPTAPVDFWGRPGTSSITQPPMFGHAIAELVRRGVAVPPELVDKAIQGLRFFLEFRRHEPSGLVRLCHPWESGADNNPRWDGYYTLPHGDESWQDEKIGFLETIVRTADGTPLSNPAFDVASPYFTSLVAFNIFELANATGAMDAAEAHPLVAAVEDSWDDELGTWVDVGSPKADRSAPVLDALLCILVDSSEARLERVAAQLRDPQMFAAPYGPAGVAQSYPGYDGDGYWRGSAWPQLTYLLWVALRQRGRAEPAAAVAEQLKQGAVRSGFAEHWNPQNAKPGGAVPQSWAALCVAVE